MGEENRVPTFDPENPNRSGNAASEPVRAVGDTPPSETTFDSSQSGAASAKSRGRMSIGPYVLVRKLGEGGMGQVWLAEQTAPVKRQVALKLIKGGLYDSAVIQRFESEGQSLAVMNHPAIAKVFDAGTTKDSQPYFVMEFVDGPPITRYCDNKKLNIRERLGLFIKVCDGVQHAHQKAIIHRDLKPSNILVVEVDGKATPRIIDFGVAKAFSPQAGAEQTQFTEIGALVGTRGFMSPEQADPNVLDVDTRTDVYSLGVVLYVLLTGMLPFDSEGGKKKPIDEMLRQLREEDPPSPSTKVNTEKETATAAAERRGTDSKQLGKSLQGDLDWITMKAVGRDRARRYGTPSELAADIERYLENRPVVARPASTGYRLKKYVQRHGVAVAAASGAALLLVAFAITQSVQLRRTTRERDRANRITDFMTGMFKVSDPSESRGNSVTAREILDKASKEIDTGLTKDPELQAQLMDVMGSVYGSLGLYPRAQPLLERTVQTQRHILGPKNPETLGSMDHLAVVLYYEGRYAEAEKLDRETLGLRRRVLGPEHPETLISMRHLAATLKQEGHYPEAERIEREALDLQRRVLGPDHPDTLKILNNLALTLADEGRYPEAEKLYREDLEIERRVLAQDHPDIVRTIGNLALTVQDEGRYSDAESLQREALGIQRRVLGPEHPDTLRSIGNLAWTLQQEGHYLEAETFERDALNIQRRVLGSEHPDTLRTISNLAWILQMEGHFAEAEKFERETLAVRRRVLGPEHPETLTTINSLAVTLKREGRYPESEKLLREMLEVQSRALGPEHLDTLATIGNLAMTLQEEARYLEAEKLLREMLDIERRVRPEHPHTLKTINVLAWTLLREGRYAEAESLYREALGTERRVLEPDRPETASSLYGLGCLAALQGRKDEALSLLREAVDHGLESEADLSLENNPDLRALRSDPRFAVIVADAKQRVTAAQKEN
jgi:serine/threonine protein kinase/Flp pilus assembly protein TadD